MALRKTFRQIALACSFLAAFSSLGGAWMIGQSAAWARMIVDYGQRKGLVQGIRDTFDGKHPCRICHEIAKRKHLPPRSDATASQLKFEVYTLATSGRRFAGNDIGAKLAPPLHDGFFDLSRKPKTPPPRSSEA